MLLACEPSLQKILAVLPARSSLLATLLAEQSPPSSIPHARRISRNGVQLNILSGYFKRIHCITFGAPPVSLLPLAKPERRELRKSLFLGFVNEGDPVARADKAYVKSLLELYAAPAPNNSNTDTAANSTHKLRPLLTGNKAASSSTLTVNKIRPSGPTHTRSAPAIQTPAPIWAVPPQRSAMPEGSYCYDQCR